MVWFVDGSGGDSHLCISFRNWLPKEMCKALQSALMRLKYDERLILSRSLAACCIAMFVSSPPERVMG